MSSRDGSSSPARRTRDEMSGDEGDIAHGSSPPLSTTTNSQHSKRLRTDDYDPNHLSTGTRSARSNGTVRHGRHLADRVMRSALSSGSDDEFHQPGAIVRVRVSNFVTYEDAIFYPGPNLNMVIGPNGTGKSSLVCAICLGLGYSPKHLGRAGQVGEFVKHGRDDAEIEIELKRQPGELENNVVKVRITRDGDRRKWWINENETALKAVQALVRSYGIQVDNLCQFLPQDRVAEFAALSPIELLHETQRAAAPEEMLQWHDELKNFRKDEKGLQLANTTDKDTLANHEQRQENLRGDVERLQERAQIQQNVLLLEKSVPFVEYRVARTQFHAAKARKQDAQRRLRSLEEQVEPTLRDVNAKQEYQHSIEKAVAQRKQKVSEAEKLADRSAAQIAEHDQLILNIEQERNAEIEADKRRKLDLQESQRKIRDLKSRLENAPPAFDATEFNARIRAKEHRIREIESEIRDNVSRNTDISSQARVVRPQIDKTNSELEGLESQKGRMVNKLKALSDDTARCWQWVQDNKDKFEMEVFGPPLITCSVKDARYVDIIEAVLQKSDVLSITAQCMQDFKVISDYVHKGSGKLVDVSLKCASGAVGDRKDACSKEELRRLGLDAWAYELLSGPDPVLSMLYHEKRLYVTAVSLQDVDSNQFNMIQDSEITSFVSGKTSYSVSRRKEYGPGATSTSTRHIRKAQWFTDQPADTNEKRELQERLSTLKEEFEALKTQSMEAKARIETLRSEKETTQADAEEIRGEKNTLQRAAATFAAIPAKIEREEESLETKRRAGIEVRERLYENSVKQDDLSLQKAALALRYEHSVATLRICHEEMLEAEIRLIEAASDVEALEARNSVIKAQLDTEKRLVVEVEAEAKQAKDVASKALEVCKKILVEEEEHAQHFRDLDSELTLEGLRNDIEAERSKLDFVHEGNPGALREFEARKQTIEKLTRKLNDSDRRLQQIATDIAEVRRKWEPELDKLIQKISDAFSHNFEQIGCVGEVGVHKDDDFDLWSIEIKVKFRENETLQLLDQHRQSGGERSVSTIFYLMSLQALARAPFRVVDEINQGMDPRNERMVHERMVEIACKEHTSQYFLITPKLLTGLRYDPRMKVLLINSGEHMPQDHKQFSLRQAINIRRSIATGA